MPENTRSILVIGLGSIGRRHFNNLKALGVERICVVSSNKELVETLNVDEHFHSLWQALQTRTYSAAFICTPTAYHVEQLVLLVEKNIPNIYLEKPVSHNLENVFEIEASILEKRLNVFVGFDLHFDPGIRKVKELLSKGSIGRVISVNASVGQYLPDWRPQQDYKQGMSAKASTGGGVMLDLVHEFDYLYYLFGKVAEVACFYKNSGVLDIETEDIANVLCSFQDGVIGSIHLDYLQRKLVRYCRITGSKGTIVWKLQDSRVEWITGDYADEFDYSGFERNDRFIDILRAFLFNQTDDRLTTYSQGLESLKMVISAKKYNPQNQKPVFEKPKV